MLGIVYLVTRIELFNLIVEGEERGFYHRIEIEYNGIRKFVLPYELIDLTERQNIPSINPFTPEQNDQNMQDAVVDEKEELKVLNCFEGVIEVGKIYKSISSPQFNAKVLKIEDAYHENKQATFQIYYTLLDDGLIEKDFDCKLVEFRKRFIISEKEEPEQQKEEIPVDVYKAALEQCKEIIADQQKKFTFILKENESLTETILMLKVKEYHVSFEEVRIWLLKNIDERPEGDLERDNYTKTLYLLRDLWNLMSAFNEKLSKKK